MTAEFTKKCNAIHLDKLCIVYCTRDIFVPGDGIHVISCSFSYKKFR